MSNIEAISRTVHEAVRAWSFAVDNRSIPEWSQAPAWMQESTRDSVRFVIDNPDAGVGAQHNQWMAQKRADGWIYGASRDDDLKTHPSLVPFEDLPETEQQKDRLIINIVQALA